MLFRDILNCARGGWDWDWTRWMDGWTAFMLMGARLLIRFDSVLQQWRTWTGAGRRGRGDGHDEMSEGTWQNG